MALKDKFIVRLAGEQRQELERLAATRKRWAATITRARVLLKADAGSRSLSDLLPPSKGAYLPVREATPPRVAPHVFPALHGPRAYALKLPHIPADFGSGASAFTCPRNSSRRKMTPPLAAPRKQATDIHMSLVDTAMSPNERNQGTQAFFQAISITP
jgi:hypothetical protein